MGAQAATPVGVRPAALRTSAALEAWRLAGRGMPRTRLPSELLPAPMYRSPRPVPPPPLGKGRPCCWRGTRQHRVERLGWVARWLILIWCSPMIAVLQPHHCSRVLKRAKHSPAGRPISGLSPAGELQGSAAVGYAMAAFLFGPFGQHDDEHAVMVLAGGRSGCDPQGGRRHLWPREGGREGARAETVFPLASGSLIFTPADWCITLHAVRVCLCVHAC